MRFILTSGCVIALIAANAAAFAQTSDSSREVSAQRRTRLTVYPAQTHPGPNATRHCDSWLEKEFRPSGTVVVPRMRCYWR